MTGEPVSCHLPSVSCEAVWQCPSELVKTGPSAHHVVLWDGAGFHQPPDKNDPQGAERRQMLVPKLPPYGPELNPTEKIRDQLKDPVCNQVFDSPEALRAGLRPKLKACWEYPEGLLSLIGANWLRQKVNACSPNILPAFNGEKYYFLRPPVGLLKRWHNVSGSPGESPPARRCRWRGDSPGERSPHVRLPASGWHRRTSGRRAGVRGIHTAAWGC